MTEADHLINETDLDAYVDGRLPESSAGEMVRYLADNPSVRARVAQDIAARDVLRQRLAFIAEQPIPARLRIRAIRARRRAMWMARLRSAAACAGILVLGAASGWQARGLIAGLPGQRGTAAATEDAFSAHRMFVAETVHPVEVAATQQAHLVQWLSKRVGHKLTTPDLSARGFALMGGRLLPTGSAAAAQFMYENNAGQRLTLYIRVSTSADTEFRFAQNGEIGAFSWVEDGLRFAMVGATGRDDLLALAEIVYRQLDPSRPPPKAPL